MAIYVKANFLRISSIEFVQTFLFEVSSPSGSLKILIEAWDRRLSKIRRFPRAVAHRRMRRRNSSDVLRSSICYWSFLFYSIPCFDRALKAASSRYYRTF